MITPETIRQLSLSFEETEEKPHFEKTSFRVKGKIFATLDIATNKLVIKLSEIDQSVFSGDKTAIYPVPNKWGKQGWTMIDLAKVEREILEDALTTAYCEVAPAKLGNKYRRLDI